MTLSEIWQRALCATSLCIAILPAAAAPPPLGGLLACREIQDSTSRLACFDRETDKLRASAAGGESAPVVISATPPPPALPPLNAQQQFGLSEGTLASREVQAGARPAPAPKITAHLTQVAGAPDGRLVFTLDNDQVWKQIALEGELLARQGQAVTISRGWLNSYNLVLENGRGCKVQRVQ